MGARGATRSGWGMVAAVYYGLWLGGCPLEVPSAPIFDDPRDGQDAGAAGGDAGDEVDAGGAPTLDGGQGLDAEAPVGDSSTGSDARAGDDAGASAGDAGTVDADVGGSQGGNQDAGTDAGLDASGAGAGRDAGSDAGGGALHDAGPDGSAPRDAGPDGSAPRDAGPDGSAPRDAGPDGSAPRDAGPDGSVPSGQDAGDAGGTGGVTNACTSLLANIQSAFPAAGALVDCHQVTGGAAIADSLFDLSGVVIDNEGVATTPCVAVLCDTTYAYVAGNSVPHYDFVPMTPSALAATPRVYRIPLAPVPVSQQASAQNAGALLGCEDAYDQYMFDSNTGTTSDPSGLCQTTDGAASYLYDVLTAGRADYQRLPCGFATGLTISGVASYGPNEAATPDPYGNPSYNYPNDGSDTYGVGASLDLCGGHVGDAMHYHATKYACFERDDDSAPLYSYDDATSDFDIGAALKDGCTEPSGIVGWSADGYPIKGPCVCVARAGDGSCTEVRKARSGWVYEGLRSWGTDPDEASVLGVEGMSCTSDSNCCAGRDCDFSCSYAVTENAAAPGGTTVDKRCVQINYAWCVHKFVERTDATPDGASFAYLDRCNGFDGPDGYAYHATMSFPLLQGCYRGQVGGTRDWVWSQSNGGPGGGMTGGTGGMTGGGTMGGATMGGGMPGGTMGGGTTGGTGGMTGGGTMGGATMGGGMPGGTMGGTAGGTMGGGTTGGTGGMTGGGTMGGGMPGGTMGGTAGGTMGGGMTGGGVPTCSVGQTMCCGDGVCDGPETVSNCSADCH